MLKEFQDTTASNVRYLLVYCDNFYLVSTEHVFDIDYNKKYYDYDKNKIVEKVDLFNYSAINYLLLIVAEQVSLAVDILDDINIGKIHEGDYVYLKSSESNVLYDENDKIVRCI